MGLTHPDLPCGPLLADTNMAGTPRTPLRSRHLLKAALMVLVAFLLVHSTSAQAHREFVSPGQQKREASADILTQIGRSLKETLDTWLGPETMHVISEVRKVVPGVVVCRKERKGIVNAPSPHRHIFCPGPCCRERAPPSTNTSWHSCL